MCAHAAESPFSLVISKKMHMHPRMRIYTYVYMYTYTLVFLLLSYTTLLVICACMSNVHATCPLVSGGTFAAIDIIIFHIPTYPSLVQDFVVALMMGTHSRLGADSPLLLLGPYIAACIGQLFVADRW